jgi:DnaJ-class molecular chaperone
MQGYETCPDCDGDGGFEDRACARCGGDGEVPVTDAMKKAESKNMTERLI